MEKKNKVKAPVKGKIAKVPVVIQMEALECGASCLTMILAYYGKWIPPEQVRSDCGVSRDGSNAHNIVKAARNYGLSVSAYRLEPEELKNAGSFPCIIHWNFNHFVVLDGFKGNFACINDPAKGNCMVSMEDFDRSFTGVCIMFEPGESFQPSGHPKSVWKFAAKRLSGLKTPIIITILTTVITSLLGVITPVLDRIFYDRLLTGRNPEWFRPFLMVATGVFLVQLTVASISSLTSLRINGKVSLVGNLSYMWKVLHLPMIFFSQRMTGDIVSRQSGNTSVANTLVNTLSPILLNAAMMVFYLSVMIRYSVALTVVGIMTVILNMLVTGIMTKRRVNLSRILLRDQGKLASATISGIQMMETIKSSGAEEGFFEKWSGNFASVNSNNQQFTARNRFLNILPSIISSVSGSVILGMGIYLTMKGRFTLGSITAFQGFFTAFMNPVKMMIDAGSTFQEMRTDMERIDDVMEYPDDPNVVDIQSDDLKNENIAKLSGEIEIRNITFGYSPLAEPLIKDFSMSVKPGSRVAFVGSSGCGKSTLSKLISGMYVPWSGEILFDGRKVSQIDRSVFTGSLAVVDQDITLFEDSIADNIKMWDDSIENFEMIMAARDAQMHYDIVAKDGGYQHMLTEGGKDFSGGQRQRLEIARVLAQDPTIIILDEATSALDAKTEYEVVKAIKDRGITCIVIAHRLSTIRDCDEIVVLDHGNVVERGTHEELMKLNGYYTGLITND